MHDNRSWLEILTGSPLLVRGTPVGSHLVHTTRRVICAWVHLTLQRCPWIHALQQPCAQVHWPKAGGKNDCWNLALGKIACLGLSRACCGGGDSSTWPCLSQTMQDVQHRSQGTLASSSNFSVPCGIMYGQAAACVYLGPRQCGSN